jgi:hypothetical protein
VEEDFRSGVKHPWVRFVGFVKHANKPIFEQDPNNLIGDLFLKNGLQVRNR